MSFRILIADDDPVISRLLQDIIKKQKYEPIVAKNGEEAIDKFFKHKEISLCILDVMMPIYNGFEVLETIREHSDIPVIMLTALGDEVNELAGFQKGVDDYISKPFSYPILLARIESFLKKYKKDIEQIFEKDDLKVDFKSHIVTIKDDIIKLNKKEFELLNLFIKNKSQVLTREQILDKIWGYDYDGEIRTVDTHIKMLRKKLEKNGEFIITIRGVGYKFMV